VAKQEKPLHSGPAIDARQIPHQVHFCPADIKARNEHQDLGWLDAMPVIVIVNH
jgi:hypothetical protein